MERPQVSNILVIGSDKTKQIIWDGISNNNIYWKILFLSICYSAICYCTLHKSQDTHELKGGKYKVLSHLLEETTKYTTINFVTSLSVLGVLRRTQKYVAGHCFFLSRCCTTADLMKSNHNIFCHNYIALTSFAILEYSVQKLISQLFRNLFSIFSIAGLRTPLTSSRCQVGRSLPPSRAIHRTLPALQQVRPYYLKMLSIATITISISISILSKDVTLP